MMRATVKYVIVAIVGLGLTLVSTPAFSAQVAGRTSTKTVPVQSSTQTAPLPSTTQAVPLPSTTREYQQMDKPPVKRLDVPDWDLAGELRNLKFHYWKKPPTYKKIFNGFTFRIALMNKGKLNITRHIPVRVTVLNITNNTIIKRDNHLIRNQTISNSYWNLTPEIFAEFVLCSKTASKVNDVKLIVDIDPTNVFKEAQRHRGNNRCVATW